MLRTSAIWARCASVSVCCSVPASASLRRSLSITISSALFGTSVISVPFVPSSSALRRKLRGGSYGAVRLKAAATRWKLRRRPLERGSYASSRKPPADRELQTSPADNTISSMHRISALLVVGLLSSTAPGGAQTVTIADSWTARTQPVHIIDNIYYVGTVDLASYLITTPAGHILIDTGMAQNADAIAAGITALGFKVRDIRMLLTTQAHFDHVAAFARMKVMTGARVLVSAGDAPLVAGGGKGDYLFGPDYYYEPTTVDEIVKDGEPVRLGGVELTPHLTPGHTPGDTTWTMRVKDEQGAVRNVVFAGSTTVNPGTKLVGNEKYPAIADDYRG